jgi:hypothetical protein
MLGIEILKDALLLLEEEPSRLYNFIALLLESTQDTCLDENAIHKDCDRMFLVC